MGLAPQVLSSYESDNPNSYDDKSYESAPPCSYATAGQSGEVANIR